MANVSKEFVIEYIRRPNLPLLYGVKYDGIMLAEFASYPSGADCQRALEQFRMSSTTQETSARVRQLSERKYRHGQFPRDDDDFTPPAAA